MENKRYIDHLHWVFDFPHEAGPESNVDESPRMMMIYDRATDVMKIEILEKGLPADARERILSWLHENNPFLDGLNG